MPKKQLDRGLFEEFDRLAGEIVEAWKDDRDADVSNLIDEGLRRDAKLLAWALARRAADPGP